MFVNRFAQILTEELDIPKSEPITIEHFSKAHAQLLRERNTHTEHLVTNIRHDRRFEAPLMKIASYDEGVAFNPYNELISEFATYGVIGGGGAAASFDISSNPQFSIPCVRLSESIRGFEKYSIGR